ncbi:MAG: DUF4115 domain-containing protein [Woeseiaceae bacterium]|nr:DUF4115 domain-containing protein [Woeseiaceae bacterium]
MNDETDNEQSEPQAADPTEAEKASEPEGPLAGERLAAARREKQITVLEIAKELHLDEPKVRALERNEFEILGAPVFAKGHLKKYASLVGVSADDVLADYYQLNRSSGMPPVVGTVRKRRREVSPGPWIALVLLLMIAATAYWWFFERSAGEPAPMPQGPAVSPLPAEPGGDDVDTDVAQPVELPEVSVDAEAPAFDIDTSTPVTAEPVPAETTPEPAPAVAAGQVQLQLRFTGDCWTEITDADGRRLFFDLGRDGRVVNVSGQAPLSVLFGNADNVSVRVNGADYAIAPGDRRGLTARFTILAP